jgi:cobalamin biosynthesis protein CobT
LFERGEMDEVDVHGTDVGTGKEVDADILMTASSRGDNQMDDLDYEAEDDDDINTNEVSANQQLTEGNGSETNEARDDKDMSCTKALNESMEELEEGEVSDEDEESRNARLRPQPVCRFYSKGACTWGASCRYECISVNIRETLVLTRIYRMFQICSSRGFRQGQLQHVRATTADIAWRRQRRLEDDFAIRPRWGYHSRFSVGSAVDGFSQGVCLGARTEAGQRDEAPRSNAQGD